jgi:hypothetical protein
MTLRLTLANEDTKNAIANLTAENVLAFIDHIDVMGNNGSLVLERIDYQFLAFAEQLTLTVMQDLGVLFKVVLLVQL